MRSSHNAVNSRLEALRRSARIPASGQSESRRSTEVAIPSLYGVVVDTPYPTYWLLRHGNNRPEHSASVFGGGYRAAYDDCDVIPAPAFECLLEQVLARLL